MKFMNNFLIKRKSLLIIKSLPRKMVRYIQKLKPKLMFLLQKELRVLIMWARDHHQLAIHLLKP